MNRVKTPFIRKKKKIQYLLKSSKRLKYSDDKEHKYSLINGTNMSWGKKCKLKRQRIFNDRSSKARYITVVYDFVKIFLKKKRIFKTYKTFTNNTMKILTRCYTIGINFNYANFNIKQIKLNENNRQLWLKMILDNRSQYIGLVKVWIFGKV